MSLTPDQPIPPKTFGSTSLLRGLRDRLRNRHTRGSPQLDASDTDNGFSSTSRVPTPGMASHHSFITSPPVSPLISSAPQRWVGAPPPPQMHPGWAQLASPPTGSQAYTEATTDLPIEIRNLPLVFAVDISGSTRGRILEQEKVAIAHMTSKLEPAILVSQSCILPWDGRSHRSISPAQVETLQPGRGTDPSVVLENAISRQALQNSKLWFLMTDGYIEEPLINKFANAIPRTGLHGTASVIILFGYRSRYPFQCNVSVGMSVFAVAPHCVFLFHDVKSGDLYVFQAKGSFASLLPEHSRFTPFGPTTGWEDLTRVTYDELSRVRVPSPTQLSTDMVVLPGGRRFDMTPIYNTMSKEETIELLSDYSALDVILLAAKTRGRGAAVKAWIESARRIHKMPEVEFWEREDIDSWGKETMIRLLQAASTRLASDHQPEDLWDQLVSSSSQETENEPNSLEASTLEIDILRSTLRHQHVQNWSRFEAKVEADWELSRKLGETLGEVLSTMRIYDHQSSASPAMLTPMSSPAGHYMDPLTDEIAPRQLEQRCSPLSVRSTTYDRRKPVSRAQHEIKTRDLLFLPGFQGKRSSGLSSQPGLYDTCSICRQPNSIQTLLLQASSEEPDTLHLPKPDQRAGHKYPLVLGNYPETDVILPTTSCDACASLLLQAGELPNGDRVTAALPLVSLQVKENRKLWEETLAEVYRHRFHESTVFLVFLSTLCTTIEDLIDRAGSSDSPTLRRSLEWCCKELSKLPGISTRAGLTPVGSPLSGVVDDTMPLQQTLRIAFCGIHPMLPESPLIAYPIDGFVVLVRLAGLMEDVGSEAIERFVRMRLLYHFTEQHADLQKQAGVGEAKVRLEDLIYGPSVSAATAEAETNVLVSLETSEDPPPRTRLHSVSLSSLYSTYLIPSSSDILEQFQRMEEYFSAIQNTAEYHAALAVFLHILATLADGPSQISYLHGFFVQLQCRSDRLRGSDEGLQDIFKHGRLVDEDMAAKLITIAYEQV